MTVKKQKKINFVNDCEAIVDYKELENAILWYSDSPVTSVKHIYMHGKYPAVSIGKDKIHIHRLLMMYWLDSKIPTEFSVHHIDENRLNASKNNLSVVLNSDHNHRKDVSISDVKELLDKGYSINKIAKELDCDWSTVKAREKDIFDNPELLEVE